MRKSPGGSLRRGRRYSGRLWVRRAVQLCRPLGGGGNTANPGVLWGVLRMFASRTQSPPPSGRSPFQKGPLCFKRSLFNFTNKSKIDVYYLIPDTVFFVALPDFDTVNQAVYKVLVQLGYIGVLLRKLYKLRCVVRLPL